MMLLYKNYPGYLIYLFLVSIAIAKAHEGHHHDHDHSSTQDSTKKNVPPVAEAPPVPREFLTAFQDLSTSLVKQSHYLNSLATSGAVCYCPFTLGYLLAVVQDEKRVIDVPVQSIRKVLNLSTRENVTDAYSAIAHSFIEDVKVSATSTFYTKNYIVEGIPGYKKLHTVQVSIPLDGNSQPASQIINQEIQIHTKDAIVNRVVPKNPNFDSTTSGVLVNTFYYKSDWESEFSSVGIKPFTSAASTTSDASSIKTTRTPSMQTVAKLRVFEAPSYTSVSVPLLGGRKRVVFVQPKTITLKEYISSGTFHEIFETCPRSWPKREVTLQVPVLNLVLGRDFLEQLDELAGARTQCTANETTSFRDYLQPIVQVVSCKITPGGYELAVSNGVQVNNIPVPSSSSRSDIHMDAYNPSPDEIMTTMEQHPVSANARELKTTDEPTNDSDAVESELPPINLTFDKPFFIYLHDNNLGPVSFSAVDSLFDTTSDKTHPKLFDDSRSMSTHHNHANAGLGRHHIPGHHEADHDDNDNFTEESKTERWTCHTPHEHPHDH